jgi:MFS family permease
VSSPVPEESVAAAGPAPAAADSGSAKRAARGRYRDALRHRDLRLLIAGFLVDQTGSWSYIVVISVYIFDRTHSTQWLAANAACRWGPSLLVASYGGVLADRYQRTTVMVVSALASAVLMAGMAVVVASAAPVAFVLVISALSSVALAPYQPAAGALTPEIVGERDLAAANSIFSALENLVVIVGPGIGGLLLLTGRPVIGVAINAVSFAAAAAIVTRLRVRSRGGGRAEDSTAQQWAAGLRSLAAQPVAVAVILFCALSFAVYGAATVLYVPLSVRLGTGSGGYSYLLACSALGGLLGVGLANRLSGASRLAPVIMGGICLQALPYLLTVPVRGPALAGALQVVSGIGMIIVDVLALTSLQREVPGDVLGRVLGVLDTVVLAGVLLASLATGVLLAHAGVNVALVAVGVGIPVLGLVGLPMLLRADRTSAAAAERLRPRVELLSELDLLAGADRRTLERLAAAAGEIVMPAGQVVIREGDEADALWILADGKLSIQASGGGSEPRELPPVTAPGYVGELGLLHGIPRTASVRTRLPSTLLRIGGPDFLSALQVSQPSPALLSVAGTRMARTPRNQDHEPR